MLVLFFVPEKYPHNKNKNKCKIENEQCNGIFFED
jgi:hypothetical protein